MQEMLDPSNPPKFCPDCKEKGVNSKVRVFELNLDYEGVVMCENKSCKWPFSKYPSERFLIADVRELEKSD